MGRNYQAFANLIADSFFELDRELRYTYCEGQEAYFAGLDKCVLGSNRVDLLESVIQPDEPQLAIHNAALEQHQPLDVVIPTQGEDGSVIHTRITAQPQFDANNKFAGYIGCTKDVSARVRETLRIAHHASHDDLTGVINRREFESRLTQVVENQTESSQAFTLCFIDLDKFKVVNDTAGHQAGDQLLRDVTGIMRSFVCDTETLARLGGDEFGLLLQADAERAFQITERIIDAISQYTFVWGDGQFKIGASVGIAPLSVQTKSADVALAQADNACYAAKDNGRNQSFTFGVESIAYHQHRRDIARKNLIKEALQAERFALYLQPIACNADVNAVKLREVLVRLKCKNDQLLAPQQFMQLASQFEFMHKLDCWVVKNSMLALQQFEEQGSDCKLSINLSPNSLKDDAMLDKIVEMVRSAPVSSESICFEFTESGIMRNLDSVKYFMSQLHAEGVEFALDNFGGGLSSLSCLHELKIDYIKIDESFTHKIVSDEQTRIIIRSLSTMARQLGIKTIAKSIETVEARHIMTDLGLDFAQGFGVAKPRSISEFLVDVDLYPLRQMAG